MFYSLLWKERSDACSNVLLLINDYLRYSYCFFSRRTHVEDANNLIKELRAIKRESSNNNEREVYLTLKKYRDNLTNDMGDFKKRLDFALDKLETKHSYLSAAGKLSIGFAVLAEDLMRPLL